VDGFLHVLALNTAVLNWDIYGAIAHNYFLYGDSGAGGRLVWIPWDHNEAFLGDRGMQKEVLYPRATAERWPLIRYLLDDPVYRTTYLAHVRSVTDELFASGALEQRLRAEHARIAPYVVGPGGAQPGYTMLSSPERFSSALEETVQLIGRRTTELRTQLDARQP
jgi:spore coat protein H